MSTESDIANEIWALTELKTQGKQVMVIETMGDCSTTYVFPNVEDMMVWEDSKEGKVETVSVNNFFNLGGSFDDV
jgi:hypothetical protein